MSTQGKEVQGIAVGENMNSEELSGREEKKLHPLVAIAILCITVGIGFVISYVLDITLIFAIAFGIQWVVFAFHAYPNKSERLYDLTGGLTYILCVNVSFWTSYQYTLKTGFATTFVVIWALRLSSFLFTRIVQDGKDKRFDKIKVNFFRFLMAWTIQGLWVFLTALPVFIINSRSQDITSTGLSISDICGISVWVIGFSIEVISDSQKRRWNEKHKGMFIDTGLWRYSRHPNYFGEIVLWLGMLVLCASEFQNQMWLGVLSPVIVVFLLTRVSGIPMLERRADKKWGDDPEYQKYKRQVNILIIGPRRSGN